MFSAAVFLLLLLFTAPPSASAEQTFQDYLAQADEYSRNNRQREAGEALLAATALAGAEHPFLHTRLAKHYFTQGLLPEAVVQAEKAVALAPPARWCRYELARLYLAGKQYNKAEGQLRTLLRIDPGFTSGYACLAEIYVSTRQDELARLAMGRARLLGYRGKAPDGMPASPPVGPEEIPARPEPRHGLFRFIKVDSAKEAEAILQAVDQGRLFEDFELATMNGETGQAEVGVMQSSELPATIAAPLTQLHPYAPPAIVKTGRDYRVMQRILPYDPVAWRLIAERAAPAAAAAAAGEQGVQPARPAAATPASVQPAALSLLDSWKNAWETADFDGYLAVYSKSFVPADGLTYAAWKEKRQKSLRRPKTIRITISETVMQPLPNNRMLVTFRQNYESDAYRDSVIKAMVMVKEREGWRILQESIVRELPR